MALTYYDMEKLMRMVYAQKLLSSLEKNEVERSRVRDREPACDRVPCRVRPSGAAAK
jgi:hypothetical protein